MKINMELVNEIKDKEAEMAHLYDVEKFPDIDRGKVTSRANGDIIKTLEELDRSGH